MTTGYSGYEAITNAIQNRVRETRALMLDIKRNTKERAQKVRARLDPVRKTLHSETSKLMERFEAEDKRRAAEAAERARACDRFLHATAAVHGSRPSDEGKKAAKGRPQRRKTISSR